MSTRDILKALEDLEMLMRESIQDPERIEILSKLINTIKDSVGDLEETIVDLEAIIETCCDLCEEAEEAEEER